MMGFPALIILLCLHHLLLNLPIVHPQPTNGIYLANSTYSRNLEKLLSALPRNTSDHGGFANITSGEDPDKVYALALCRGDMSSFSCYNCINTTTYDITHKYPYQKDAILYGDTCMVRYSNLNIFSKVETSPVQIIPNPNDISGSLDQFNRTLYDLMGNLTALASSRPDKFATGDESYLNSTRLYGLLQCTPDISEDDCRVCSNAAMEQMLKCCGGTEGGRVHIPSCTFWFEVFKFYDSTSVSFDPSSPSSPSTQVNSPPSAPPNSSPPPPPNMSSKGKKSNAKTVIITVVPIVIIIAVILFVCAILLMRRLKWNAENEAIKELECLQINLSTIKAATNDFGDANKLGQGGFGSVYKGRLPNGQEIAVKRLSGTSSQGEEEFKNEVLLLAKLQHRNLVTLIGFCSEGNERILVYELVKNGSLDHFIFDHTKSAQLDWEMRSTIINGIARGILYLHEDSRHRIIHRDLKASNVLLDDEMNPKISDFGMARLFALDQTQFITSRAAGTYGYMAPEYALRNRFSVKSDVFSFGVLVLELVSGKKNSWLNDSDEIGHLLTHVWENWSEGKAGNMIDKVLISGSSSSSSEEIIIKCMHVGLLCVQEHAVDRPTMGTVVGMLSSHPSTPLPLPSKPAFLMCNNWSNTNSVLPSLESTSGTASASLEQSPEGIVYLSSNSKSDLSPLHGN